MSRRPARVTQADIHRAIKAVEQAGARMAMEIRPDGIIRIVPVPPAQSTTSEPPQPIEPEHEIIL